MAFTYYRFKPSKIEQKNFSGWWDEFWGSLYSYFRSIFYKEEYTQEEAPYYYEEEPKEKTIDDIIEEKSLIYGVPSNIVRAIIKVESNFNPYAVSIKGAKGLMQLMESTFRWLGFDPNYIFDPETNIEAGVKYLRYLWDKYGNLTDAIAAYNAGRVLKYMRTGRYVNQSYVDKVLTYA